MTPNQAKAIVKQRFPDAKVGRFLKVETNQHYWFLSGVGRSYPGFPTEGQAWEAVAEFIQATQDEVSS